MRVLISTQGSYGDVHPFLAIALASQARGHDVVFLANEHFRGLIEDNGLRFVPTGTEAEYTDAFDDPAIWNGLTAFGVACEKLWFRAFDAIYDAVSEWLEPGNSVVVTTPIAPAERSLREITDFRLVTLALTPATLRSAWQAPHSPPAWMPDWHPPALKRLQYRLIDRVIAPTFDEPLNALRGKRGLGPVTRPLHEWIHSPDLVLGSFPEWFGPTQPDWPRPFFHAGFPFFDESNRTSLADDVEAFLSDGDAPVVFNPGSEMRQPQRFFAESIAAAQAGGFRAILLTRRREEIPSSLPDGIAHFDYVPFSQVLPRTAALVSHGGIGTIAQALRAGIPQLVKPMAHDQFDNVARLERLGVGKSIPDRRYRAGQILRRLQPLLHDGDVRSRARELADRLVADGPSAGRIVDRLEETHRVSNDGPASAMV